MADNLMGLQTKPMTDFEKAQALVKSKQQTPAQLNAADEAAYSARVAASKPAYQLDIGGQKYNPSTGAKEANLAAATPAVSPAPLPQPSIGLTTSGMGKSPAAYANPAVSTPAPIAVGQPAPVTSSSKKGLFEQAGDWYSKLNPSQQDSTNKALMAAGFNLMQTGGTTYRTPISNAALFGQAGTVGLKTYEADQAAKAKAASEAAKLKFDQEYKTAKLGLVGGRGRGSGAGDKAWQTASKNAEGQFVAMNKMSKDEAKQYASAQPGQTIALASGIRIIKGKSDADTQYILPGVPMKMNRDTALNHLTTGEFNKANPSAGGTGVNSPSYNQNPYVVIGGRQIPISRINQEAAQHGVAPEDYVDTLMKLSNK